MRCARSILAAFFFAAFAVGGLLVGVVIFPLVGLLAFADGRRSRAEIVAVRRRWLVRQTYRLFVWAAGVTGLFRVEISPEDRLRLAALRGSVVVANHLTLIDVVLFIALLGDTTAVAKVAASRNPFYACIVRSVFLVNDDAERVLNEASQLLSNGVNLIVFPEGTRTLPAAANRKLHRGAAQIALAANAPLEVVKISCEPLVLGKGQAWYDVGRRTIVYTLQHLSTISPGHSPRIKADIPATPTRHAEAVELTSKIGARLFG